MNKKIISIFFVMIFISQVAFAAETTFWVNGESYTMAEPVIIKVNGVVAEFEVSPYIYKSRTIVPMKFLFNELGYDVTWQAATRTVTGVRGDNTIVLQIDNSKLFINDEVMVSDIPPVIINDRTYVPLSIIAKGTGAEVLWDGELRTVSVNQKLEDLNLFYGKSSIYNYNKLYQNDQLDTVNSIAYVWSRVEFVDGKVTINTASINNNLMFYPDDHELVTKNDVKNKLLNVYFDGDYETIFNHKEALITEIVNRVLKPNIEDPSFDGVVMDFELMNEKYFEEYLDVVKSIKAALNKQDKLLYVAIQPRLEYNFADLIRSVDRLILMVHDYESKDKIIVNFNQNYVNQPISPIDRIESDLQAILAQIGNLSDRSKISLQLSIAVVQWQGQTLYEVNRFTPSYSKLIERMEKLSFVEFYFDEISKNPYLQYIDENGNYNTIWYENESSIQEKIDLVYQYNLGGISLWQIANIPFIEVYDDKFDLNIWQTLKKNY